MSGGNNNNNSNIDPDIDLGSDAGLYDPADPGPSTPVATTPSGIHPADVAKHNTKQDCWVIINGHVWNVTDWLDNHPGGVDAIFPHAGQDASAAYNGQHEKDLVFSTLPNSYLGEQLNALPTPPNTGPTGNALVPLTAPVINTPTGPGFGFTDPVAPTKNAPVPPITSAPAAAAPFIFTKPAPPKSNTPAPSNNNGPAPLNYSFTSQSANTKAPSPTPVPPTTSAPGPTNGNGVVGQTDVNQIPPVIESTNKAHKRSADYKMRMLGGWTVNDGTFDPVPENKRQKTHVPYPAYVSHAFRARAGLSNLQLSRDSPISLCAMDIATHHLWKCMPGQARRYLHLASPNGPALWGPNEEAVEMMYQKMDDKAYHVPVSKGSQQTEYQLYSDVKKRPWIIWPLWVEDEWGSDYVTVIWHSTNTPQAPDRFDQLLFYSIIDPRRSPDANSNGRNETIKGRISRIANRLWAFWAKAGINRQKLRFKEVLCSPMPFDETSSGERTFAVIKTLINQIIDWHTLGMNFTVDGTITNQSQWVHPYQQRVEMTGINAWILMASLRFDARITVEALQPNTVTEVAANGNKKYVHTYDLAGPFQEPPVSAPDYLLPPSEIYKVGGS
ncbi:hypothetical protein E0Z10_g1222 [Xylaria hypoxylon]|uniref:Cytochrome b5 heme-binding domain-containing protein n=1 Tax=Xylaria hypoxylon TaxID=37992 RepID=A0A4Z0Z7F4_9PEZI|nr:hypothetical protein E0Z10_g1222 [Xylaria hypoxylon]